MMKTELVSTHQDIVTGHQTDQDQGPEGSGQYVTIQQAAQLCGVSSKTIQRAIHAGTLPACYPQKNRCEIAVRDLEHIRPGLVSGQVPEPLEQRVATLEQRVQQLEQSGRNGVEWAVSFETTEQSKDTRAHRWAAPEALCLAASVRSPAPRC